MVKQMVRIQPEIQVDDDGPYILSGSFKLIDAQGNQYDTDESISLCRCGHSGDKPFCDGTHEAIDFDSSPRADNL
ncbi:MAG TPA: CDGSH iron-sulfur domain-containing protein [Bacillota bacterium]|nr:CDGSH iron-sulfur domain-containing protein [Bacillota bacterium]